MNCKEVKNKLSEYLDNMMSESQAVLIKEHLDTCSQCRIEYYELKIVSNLDIRNSNLGLFFSPIL